MKKNILFCGAAKGLGLTIAQTFLASGWTVIILDLMWEGEEKDDLYFYKCDVSDYELTEKIIKQVFEKFNTIDGLVNCIRYRSPNKTPLQMRAEWGKSLSIDLDTYFYSSSIVCELAKSLGMKCSIVNMASVLGDLINLNESIAYHSAKAAITQMTRYLAIQYGPYGIRANTISPGLISNQEAEHASSEPLASLYARFAQYIPLKRSGSPTDIAELVLFLISEKSAYITAQNITIDGGLTYTEHLAIIQEAFL